jgi:hypothetical protein
MFRWLVITGSGICLMLSTLSAPNVCAQQFRIESEVFAGDEEDDPASTNLTIFNDGVVYDFALTPTEQVAVLDESQSKFVLLDPQRRVKLTITLDEVLQLVAALKTSKRIHDKDPFLFEPKFEVGFDDETQELSLSSDRMTYKVKGEKPNDQNAMQAYRGFIDWYVRLNAVDPRKMPPFARLELNRELTERQIIPTEVKFSFRVSESALSRTMEMRSVHHVVWQISQRDRDRIDTVRHQWVTFEEVDRETYFELN